MTITKCRVSYLSTLFVFFYSNTGYAQSAFDFEATLVGAEISGLVDLFGPPVDPENYSSGFTLFDYLDDDGVTEEGALPIFVTDDVADFVSPSLVGTAEYNWSDADMDENSAISTDPLDAVFQLDLFALGAQLPITDSFGQLRTSLYGDVAELELHNRFEEFENSWAIDVITREYQVDWSSSCCGSPESYTIQGSALTTHQFVLSAFFIDLEFQNDDVTDPLLDALDPGLQLVTGTLTLVFVDTIPVIPPIPGYTGLANLLTLDYSITAIAPQGSLTAVPIPAGFWLLLSAITLLGRRGLTLGAR